MTNHVVVRIGKEDLFVPETSDGELVLNVPFGVSDDPDQVSLSLVDDFAAWSISPSLEALDLLCATIGAYTADTRISRKSTYDGWTRDIILYIPVQNIQAWESVVDSFQKMLRFLTGDHWKVIVRQGGDRLSLRPLNPPRHVESLKTSTVCLFSGGLDSYIGAIDQLSDHEQVLLVGHHSLGGGPTSTSQKHAIESLHAQYTSERAPFLKLWVSPPKGKSRASEITTRGRSILFLGLGVAVTSSIPNGKLVIPENGLISLNVPLTDSRLGSLSTRTTHPYLIHLLREILSGLGIPITVELPYRFATKGEMLKFCRDQTALNTGLLRTMSCARPGASRFQSGGSANQHCGYCFPCLIRRAAILAARGNDVTPYGRDVLHDELTPVRRSDVRAVKMALARYAARPPRLSDILIPGPLPVSDEDLSEYLGVFSRGLDEIRRFLQ
jgi:hypothetical protein